MLSDTSEKSTRYFDMLGREYKTVYAAASGTPSHTLTYNTAGQLSKEVDPDGVTTLFEYNSRGELEYTTIDMNLDGARNTTGTDRIRLLSDVVSNHGTDVLRKRTF